MNFFLHPLAEKELDEATKYYEECQPGLGLEFAEEVYSAIERLCAFPQAWTSMSKNTRRCLVNRFPYGVVFQIKTDSILVIAVANLNRRPGYWMERT